MMLASNGNVTDIYGKERAAEDALVDEGGRQLDREGVDIGGNAKDDRIEIKMPASNGNVPDIDGVEGDVEDALIDG